MHRSRLSFAVLVITCFCLATVGPLAQKGKGKGNGGQSSDIPGTAVIRCDASDDVCHDLFHPDFGSGGPYVDDRISPDPEGIVAHLDAGASQFRLRLLSSNDQRRSFVVSFSGARVANAEFPDVACGPGHPTDSCALAGLVTDDELAPGPGIGIAARATDGSNAGGATNVDLANGLLDMDLMETLRSTFCFCFNVDIGDLGSLLTDQNTAADARWAVHWSDTYPGSGRVNVTRTAQCTWEVWSDGEDDELGGLLLHDYGEPTGRGKAKNALNYEGLFRLRFNIEFTADAGSCPEPQP